MPEHTPLPPPPFQVLFLPRCKNAHVLLSPIVIMPSSFVTCSRCVSLNLTSASTLTLLCQVFPLCTYEGPRAVLSMKNCRDWINPESLILWQHYHTRVLSMKRDVTHKIVTDCSSQKLEEYRKFVRSSLIYVASRFAHHKSLFSFYLLKCRTIHYSRCRTLMIGLSLSICGLSNSMVGDRLGPSSLGDARIVNLPLPCIAWRTSPKRGNGRKRRRSERSSELRC